MFLSSALLQHILSVLLASSSSSRTSSSNNKSSIWAPSEWKIHLNIGRENDTPKQVVLDKDGGGNNDNTGDDWGASGARLALTVPILIQSDTAAAATNNDDDEDDDDALFLGSSSNSNNRGHNQLQVLDKASFVSMQGLQEVQFSTQGAWRLSTTRPTGSKGDASTLRMILKLPADTTTLQRNDVVIKGPQKLYLMANAWRDGAELQVAQQRLAPIQRAYQQAQQELEEQLSHETGDRRLDGNNLFDTAAASMDMAQLVKQRDDCWSALRQAQLTLPYDELSDPGDWPGSDEALVIQKGTIWVKQQPKATTPAGFLFGGGGRDEMAVIGRWSASPMEKVEYYDEEDEDFSSYFQNR